MTRSYKQLDILERQRIYFLRKQGFSLRKIAEDLSRSPSTILREVKRNSGGRGYRCAQAQRKARQRGVAASSVPRKMTASGCGPSWRRNLAFSGVPIRYRDGSSFQQWFR